jgi:hypothetical protein
MEKDNKNEINSTANKTAEHNPSDASKNVMVETYAEDMASVIGGGAEEGLIKKIIHGEEENEKEKKNQSPETKKNKVFMILGVLFLVIALATVSFLILTRRASTVPVAPSFTPIIFSDRSVSLEISGLKKDDIEKTVLNEVNATPVNAGGLEGIYLTENKQPVGLRSFITLIGSVFAPSTNPLFVEDNFLLGVVKNQSDITPTSGTGFFILLKVRSSTDIFDSLRAWEPTMLTDLHGFLGVNEGSDTSYLFTKDFEDGIVENKNARILYDNSGNVVLMYIFADDNSVIVTDSDNAAHEIVLRLSAGQIEQ